jgi:hypothetical protein
MPSRISRIILRDDHTHQRNFRERPFCSGKFNPTSERGHILQFELAKSPLRAVRGFAAQPFAASEMGRLIR